MEELNTFLLDLRANVGKLVQGDPTSGDDTVAVLLAGTGLYKDPANTVNVGNDDDTLILTNDAVAVNQDFDFVWTGLHTFSAGLRFGPLGGFYTRFNQGSQSGNIAYTLPAASAVGVLHNDGSSVWSWSAVSLTTDVTGVLPIANGGTNATATPTAGGVAYGTGTAYAFTSAGTSGDWLRSTGAGAPAFTNPAALTKIDDTNVTLTLGGSPTTALLNAASLTLGWTGQLSISRGGTAASTALGAFNNLSPLTTRGDLLTRDATNNIRLGIGASGTVLRSDGTDPAWTSLSGAGIVAGTGTTNTLAKWTSASTLGDSLVSQDVSGSVSTQASVGPLRGGAQLDVKSGGAGAFPASLLFTGGTALSGSNTYGGSVFFFAGQGDGADGGGGIGFVSGAGGATGYGGPVAITAGAGGSTSGTGGGIVIQAGSGGGTSGAGGYVNVIAGNALGGNSNGGSIYHYLGVGTGSGADGEYEIVAASGVGGVLNFDSLTANRIFTFPDLTGTLALTSLAGGGTNAALTASNGGIVYSNATQLAILAGTATAGQMLRSGASTAPTWSTATFPATAGAANNVLVSDGTNWISTTVLSSTPPTDITLTASAVGTGTTYARADHRHGLDQTIAPTWTAVHTFSSQDVHNAGVSLGTSGRFNSAVADAVSAISFQYKPSVALTSGTDRRLHSFEDSAGTKHMAIMSDGTIQFNGGGVTGGYFTLGGTITAASRGIYFPCTIDNTGATTFGVTNVVAGALFYAQSPATVNATSLVGGIFAADHPGTISANITRNWGGWFRATFAGGTGNSTRTWTEQGGVKVWGIPSAMNFGTITDYYGGYIENSCTSALGSGQAITNARGLYIEEQTRAGTINNGIFLANATAGYKAIAIRDQNTWIGSSAAATLDLQATTVLVTADMKLSTAGNGVYIKEGTNATSGVATLVGGTVVVNTTKVTANTRVHLTIQALGTVATPKAIGVTARTAGTSFTITSADATDTSVIGWTFVEPA